MPHITFNKSNIYYEVHGSGDPVVFLHGWNESMESFKFNLLDKIKNEYQIILIDFPGHGCSEMINLSFDDLCALIDEVLCFLNIKEINLIGCCMGGIVALDYTIRNQNKVKKLLLLETFIDFPFVLEPFLFQKINYWYFNFLIFNRFGFYLTRKALFLKRFNYRKEYIQLIRESDPLVSIDYIKLMKKYSLINHYKRIENIKIKTKIISGIYSNKLIARMINKIIINGEVAYLPHAGHFPIEENSEDLTILIKDFFE